MIYNIHEIAEIIGANNKTFYPAKIHFLLTDSRTLSFPDYSLFFAIQTKTNDGHKYIRDLYNLRVRNFVVNSLPKDFKSMPGTNFLLVKDTRQALQKLAIAHRNRFHIPVIGITGSNGKTVSKSFCINYCTPISTSSAHREVITPK